MDSHPLPAPSRQIFGLPKLCGEPVALRPFVIHSMCGAIPLELLHTSRFFTGVHPDLDMSVLVFVCLSTSLVVMLFRNYLTISIVYWYKYILLGESHWKVSLLSKVMYYVMYYVNVMYYVHSKKWATPFPGTQGNPLHSPVHSKGRSKGTSLPSPFFGASNVPWLLVPENPNDEVPAIARVVVQSMMLPGIMTFSGPGCQMQILIGSTKKSKCVPKKWLSGLVTNENGHWTSSNHPKWGKITWSSHEMIIQHVDSTGQRRTKFPPFAMSPSWAQYHPAQIT